MSCSDCSSPPEGSTKPTTENNRRVGVWYHESPAGICRGLFDQLCDVRRLRHLRRESLLAPRKPCRKLQEPIRCQVLFFAEPPTDPNCFVPGQPGGISPSVGRLVSWYQISCSRVLSDWVTSAYQRLKILDMHVNLSKRVPRALRTPLCDTIFFRQKRLQELQGLTGYNVLYQSRTPTKNNRPPGKDRLIRVHWRHSSFRICRRTVFLGEGPGTRAYTERWEVSRRKIKRARPASPLRSR